MRQALVIGGVPKLNEGKEFPCVALGPGNWRVEVEHVVTTMLRLILCKRVTGTQESVDTNIHNHLIEGPCDASITIFEAGNEPFINVCAVSM